MVTTRKNKIILSIINFLQENSSILTLIIVVAAGAAITGGLIVRPSNMQAILSRAAILGVVAIGHTFVILTGEFDLSTGAIFGFAIGLTSVISRFGIHPGIAAIIAIAIVSFVGFVNGVLVVKTKIPSFIVTLAMMTIIETISLVFIGSQEMLFKGLQAMFKNAFSFFPEVVPQIPIIVWLLIAVIAQLVLIYTRFGLDIYAVGGKQSSAIHSGVSRVRTKITVFVLSGMFSGIAGILLANKIGSSTPSVGGIYLLIPIAAVILGGASLYGGEGNIIGSVIGVVVISIITNLMNLLLVNPHLQQSIIAIIVLSFMYFNQTIKKYISVYNRRATSLV